MAQEGNVVGKVAVLQGQAVARARDGSERQLHLGDPVFADEVVVSGPNGHVELALDGGQSILLREAEAVTLDASVFGDDLPTVRELDDYRVLVQLVAPARYGVRDFCVRACYRVAVLDYLKPVMVAVNDLCICDRNPATHLVADLSDDRHGVTPV